MPAYHVSFEVNVIAAEVLVITPVVYSTIGSTVSTGVVLLK
jgi:hypothetical protein